MQWPKNVQSPAEALAKVKAAFRGLSGKEGGGPANRWPDYPGDAACGVKSKGRSVDRSALHQTILLPVQSPLL